MKEVLLLKCGEIVLKGLNRKTFEDRLLKNLKRRMAHVADCEISMRQSVVYVEIPEEADADAVMECACRVFGFATISRAAVCPEKTLESVIATAKDYLAANFAAAKTFKVETKRGDKKFPMTSTEISQHVGGELADLFPEVRPDMHHPDLVVNVEMREKYAFVHAGPVPGAGGMPIGSNGRAALLLSGFTDNARALLIGTNLGGLGTLIASMASLISYKYIALSFPEKKGKYLGFFTAVNLLFLAVLLVFCHFVTA